MMPVESSAIPEMEAVHRVAISGKVYADAASELEGALLGIIRKGARHLVLDLSRLDLIDSSGLSAVITAIKTIRSERKGVIVAHSVSESIGKILSLTRIDKFVRSFGSEAEAVAYLKTLG